MNDAVALQLVGWSQNLRIDACGRVCDGRLMRSECQLLSDASCSCASIISSSSSSSSSSNKSSSCSSNRVARGNARITCMEWVVLARFITTNLLHYRRYFINTPDIDYFERLLLSNVDGMSQVVLLTYIDNLQ